MNRPKGVTITSLLMYLCAVLQLAWFLLYLTVRHTRPVRAWAAWVVIIVVFAGVAFAVIWFYMQGRNWARFSVLAYSVTCLLYFLRWNGIPTYDYALLDGMTRLLVVSRAFLGVVLIYYLNTRASRGFFVQR
jgi:hypothetical protein